MGCYDIVEALCSGKLEMANEAPSEMILFETPVAVSLISIESFDFDLAVLLVLVTAKACEGGK